MYRRLAALALGVLACGTDGKNGAKAEPCSVTADGAGTTTITCPDGTTAVIHDGAPGPQGEAGAQGPAGTAGTDGADGIGGDDGSTLLGGARPPNEADGSDGDWYVDTKAKKVYGPKVNGAWGAGVEIADEDDGGHHHHKHGRG
jgi:hypothetical protein